VYLREILKGFGEKQDSCTRVFKDNQAYIAMSKNTVQRERRRHINVRRYYVRELVEEKLIKLMPCSTQEMTVDALMKGLLYPSIRMHRNTMLTATSQKETLEATSLRAASAGWIWAWVSRWMTGERQHTYMHLESFKQNYYIISLRAIHYICISRRGRTWECALL